MQNETKECPNCYNEMRIEGIGWKCDYCKAQIQEEEVPESFMEVGPNQLSAQECRGDFWLMFEKALEEAGGRTDNMQSVRRMSVEELVEIVAQNGLRIVFMPDKRIGA